MSTQWTALGPRRLRPRPPAVGVVLALLFALQTFGSVSGPYPAMLAIIAIAGGAWYAFLAWRQRAALGLLLLPLSLIWLNPFLGSAWFTHLGAVFFVAHALLSIAFATAAYTFAATEKV